MATNKIIYTKHLTVRCQQRGIKSDYMAMLDLYGREYYCRGGGVKIMFDKSARLRLRRECSDKQLLDKVLKLYYVECSGVGVAASHRKRRFH